MSEYENETGYLETPDGEDDFRLMIAEANVEIIQETIFGIDVVTQSNEERLADINLKLRGLSVGRALRHALHPGIW